MLSCHWATTSCLAACASLNSSAFLSRARWAIRLLVADSCSSRRADPTLSLSDTSFRVRLRILPSSAWG